MQQAEQLLLASHFGRNPTHQEISEFTPYKQAQLLLFTLRYITQIAPEK
jgi:hypothetical protein